MFGIIIGAIGAIAAAAMSVAESLAVVGLAIEGLKAIGNVIMSIAKALGLVPQEQDVEELGDRALQAEELGITPEDFESFEEYVRKIEGNDWEYDPEKNKDLDPEEKVKKGIEVSSGVAIERFPDLPMQDFLSLAGEHQDFFTPGRMDEISKLAASDKNTFGNIVNYVTGKTETHREVSNATDHLMNIEKAIRPGISDNEAYFNVAGFKGLK